MHKIIVFTIGLSFALLPFSFCQTVTREVAEVDAGGRVFINKGLPFDEVFNIKGDIEKNIEKVILKYVASDPTKVREYFSDSKLITPTRKQWDRLNTNESFVLGPIGPLRPGIEYKFNFTTYSKAVFEDDKKKLLKQKIFEKLVEYLGKPEKLDNTLMDALYAELNLLPSIVAGKTVTDINGRTIDIKPFGQPLQSYSQKIINLQNTQIDDKANITGELLNISERVINLKNLIIWISEDKIAGQEVSFTDDSKKILELPVNDAIPSIGKFAVKDGIKLLKVLALNSVALDELLKGKLKIGSSGLLPSTEYDKNSIDFLASLLEIISSPQFTEKFSGRNQPIVRGSSIVEATKSAIKGLLDLNKYHNSTENAKKELEEIKQFIPNFLENVFTSAGFVIVDSPTIDVVSERTPYVSVDVGITGMPNFYSVNGTGIGNNFYFFTHQAANIYFSPVNKKAPLSTFKKPFRFYKAFSLHIGVAQLIGNFNSSRFSGSLGDKSCLMFGAGYRLNRVTKIAVSCILLNSKNINPTIDNYKLKPFVGMNLSFDINVAKGLQDVGKSLNLFK